MFTNRPTLQGVEPNPRYKLLVALNPLLAATTDWELASHGFDVLAQICRNSNKTLKTESKKNSQDCWLKFYGRAGGSKVNQSYGKVK